MKLVLKYTVKPVEYMILHDLKIELHWEVKFGKYSTPVILKASKHGLGPVKCTYLLDQVSSYANDTIDSKW